LLELQIYKIIKTRRLTQAQAGEVLGIKQPHVSTLMRNRAGYFSVGRLMEFLTALGQDVRITVKPTRKARGEMAVVGVIRSAVPAKFRGGRYAPISQHAFS
jgi:predicted XRE-type DNA-binding protein